MSSRDLPTEDFPQRRLRGMFFNRGTLNSLKMHGEATCPVND